MTTVVSAVVIAAVLATTAHSQCMYSVTAIPGPWCNDLFGYPPTVATAVNEAGDAVGYYTSCDVGPSEAFVWTGKSGFVTIQRPPGVSSAGAADISDTGTIVGTLFSVANGEYHGYVYQDGVFTELPPLPGGLWCVAAAVNGAGQVVGHRSLGGGGNPTSFPYNAFIWSAETGFIDLGVMDGPASGATDVTNTGLVVGWTGNDGNISDAFLLEDGQLTLLGPVPGGFTSTANGANNYGVVVGSGKMLLQDSSVAVRAYRWKGGAFRMLGTLPGHASSSAVDVSDNGTIVGLSSDVDDNPNIEHGFIWQNGVMTDLNELVVSDVPVLIKGAGGINERGQITASGQTTFANVGFLLTPIDPPAGDIDGDCRVGIRDLLAMLATWGPCPPIASCYADLDDDGTVGVLDLVTVLQNWN